MWKGGCRAKLYEADLVRSGQWSRVWSMLLNEGKDEHCIEDGSLESFAEA